MMAAEQMTSKDFQFDTYAHIDVCGKILKDKVWIQQFRNAINYNKHLFKNKIVLDVGCGLGILSLFAARAGALKVYAVDCSNVVCYTKKIVEDNKLEHVIEVIKGRIQDINLPVDTVDIIISDWIGYCLIYQSLIDGIIFARDKWLRPKTGIIFPDKAKLYIAAIEDNEKKNDKINWWQNVYGFNMKCLKNNALLEPSFYVVQPQNILTSEHVIKNLNLNTAKMKDLTFSSTFLLKTNHSGIMDGVVIYFSVNFGKSHTKMGFSTDPWSPYMHWMQTVFFFDEQIIVPESASYFGALKIEPKDENLFNINLSMEIWIHDPWQIQVQQRFKLKRHDLFPNTNRKEINQKINKA